MPNNLRLFTIFVREQDLFVSDLHNHIKNAFPNVIIASHTGSHGIIYSDVQWKSILKQIQESNIVIYVLSHGSIISDNCRAEFSEALRLQKRIILIQSNDSTRLSEEISIPYFDFVNKTDGNAISRLIGTINEELKHVKRTKRPLYRDKTSKPTNESVYDRPENVPYSDTPLLAFPAQFKSSTNIDKKNYKVAVLAIKIGILMVLVGVIFQWLLDNLQVNRDDDKYTPIATITSTATMPSPRPSLTPSVTVVNTPSPVDENSDWVPMSEDFNSVEMMLVPPGCFNFGSNDQSSSQNVYEHCFEASFWIDKTEVTQSQFSELGGLSQPGSNFIYGDRPVERIPWHDAQQFCLSRGGRLPTEVEWEYAARGPSNFIFPWGTWDPNLPVWNGYSNGRPSTERVGQRPDNASWVGSVDLSGNVWEWTSTVYQTQYPYSESMAEVLNNVDIIDDQTRLVARGGSWRDEIQSVLSNLSRIFVESDYVDIGDVGFRCVRMTD